MKRGEDVEDHDVYEELDIENASGVLGSGSWKGLKGLCVPC